MTRAATSFACFLALAGCAGSASLVKPQPLPQQAQPLAARRVVQLDVEDFTRKEKWFETALDEELTARGLDVRHTAVESGYVVHVRVESRNADAGIARVRPTATKGSTRLDGVVAEQQQEAYRDTPAPETRPYAGPTRPGQPAAPTLGSDDFRIAANASITQKGSTAVIATSQFDERALGIVPIAAGQRGEEWKSVYRGVAMQVAKWLEGQKLE